MPNFYNPEAEFRPMDFSLWAHPEEGSAIQEEQKSALAPTSTSPVMNPTSMAPANAQTVNAGGITMPAPQIAPLPKQGVSTAVNPNQSVAGKLHDKLRNVLTGEAPQGYESILSPEEINAARPSLTQSIFLGDDTPSSGGAWKHNLDKLVAQKQQSAGIVANQQIAQKRAADQQKLGAIPEDEKGYNSWIKKAYGMAVARGDLEDLAKLNIPLQQVLAGENDAKKNAPLETSWEDTGGEKVLTNKRTGAVIATIKKTIAPKTASEIDAGVKFGADQKNKILDDYARDTKDFHQVMAGWDVLKGATKDPTLATPFAITDAYARITNPGAIVRPTTMEMIDKMGSVGQRMQKWWSHNADGQLPPDIMRDFKKTLYAIVKEHKDQYDSIREQALTRAEQSKIPRSEMESILQKYTLEDPLATPATKVPTVQDYQNSLKRKP